MLRRDAEREEDFEYFMEIVCTELKKMGRYNQTNGRNGFMFTYEDFAKFKKKVRKEALA